MLATALGKEHCFDGLIRRVCKRPEMALSAEYAWAIGAGLKFVLHWRLVRSRTAARFRRVCSAANGGVETLKSRDQPYTNIPPWYHIMKLAKGWPLPSHGNGGTTSIASSASG